MTKEAEALSDQRAWSSMVFRLIRRRWWSLRPRKNGGPLAARRVQAGAREYWRDRDERHRSNVRPVTLIPVWFVEQGAKVYLLPMSVHFARKVMYERTKK
jgi:hypothetical protein